MANSNPPKWEEMTAALAKAFFADGISNGKGWNVVMITNPGESPTVRATHIGSKVLDPIGCPTLQFKVQHIEEEGGCYAWLLVRVYKDVNFYQLGEIQKLLAEGLKQAVADVWHRPCREKAAASLARLEEIEKKVAASLRNTFPIFGFRALVSSDSGSLEVRLRRLERTGEALGFELVFEENNSPAWRETFCNDASVVELIDLRRVLDGIIKPWVVVSPGDEEEQMSPEEVAFERFRGNKQEADMRVLFDLYRRATNNRDIESITAYLNYSARISE